jgi:DNA (cytosine-5)-methyltransferase 1|tara:strand:+ start:5999 stop:7213 length:1215 start_codon:yes stop_codon:yes gene_type:complete
MIKLKDFTRREVLSILSISDRTLQSWEKKGKLACNKDGNFLAKDLLNIAPLNPVLNSNWDEFISIKSKSDYTSLELFAGGGGMAIGLEKAGFNNILLNEFDKASCNTLRYNRPNWNVVEGDVSNLDFSPYVDKVDLLAGGFPCQAFSSAGKQQGFEDTRGTLFFEFARAIKEVQPKVFVGENVKGLLSHNKGATLNTIKNVLTDLGYTLVDPMLLKAVHYKVPQKRERLFLVGIRNDLVSKLTYNAPSAYVRPLALKDGLMKGILYNKSVPNSKGQLYSDRKYDVLKLVPPGGYWRDLPIDIQKSYMGKSFYLGGGKTGIARRMHWDEPSLTLVCSPNQNQTERCHPDEVRPFTVREYARIQTFPDEWDLQGSLTAQYKQIGNAVPVNLAFAVGKSIIHLLNQL